jgi:hypothetical protein
MPGYPAAPPMSQHVQEALGDHVAQVLDHQGRTEAGEPA